MSKKQTQYFDANNRELLFEKNQNVERSLKTSWKSLLVEKAKGVKAPTGPELMKKQGITKMEEEDVKPVDDKPVDDVPPADAPVDAPAPDAGVVPPGVDPAAEPPPAPISTDAPEVAAAAPTVDPEAVEELKKFAAAKLTSLPAAGGTAESAVDETKGVFKQEIQDEQSGKTFVVIAFSKDTYPGVHALADAIEPVDQVAAGTEVPPTDVPAPGTPVGEIPPVDAAPAGDVPPADAPAPTEPAPVEEPKEDAEIKESEDKEEKEDEKKDDKDDEKEDEKEDECDEKKLEEARDPTVVGKKDWKLFFESRYSKK